MKLHQGDQRKPLNSDETLEIGRMGLLNGGGVFLKIQPWTKIL